MSSVQLVLIVWIVVLGFKGTLCAMTDQCTDECSGMDGIKDRAGQGYAWAKMRMRGEWAKFALTLSIHPPSCHRESLVCGVFTVYQKSEEIG